MLKTARSVLTSDADGEVALAMYSASNGGYTVAGDEPYLVAQADPYEGDSRDYYGWKRTFTTEQLERAFDLGNLTYLGIEAATAGPRGGRVAEAVSGSRPRAATTAPSTGEHFQGNLGLPSTLFTITKVE